MAAAKWTPNKTDSNHDNAGDFKGSLSVTQSCDLCMKGNILKTATCLCENCDEYLCDTCTSPHCVYKPGKHNIVGIDDKMDKVDMSELDRFQDINLIQETKKDSNTTPNKWKLQQLYTVDFAVAGIDFMPDGRIVTVYKSKKCIIMSDKLIKVGKGYSLRAIPLGVVCMSDNEIAVKLDSQTVCVLAVDKDCAIREKRTFKTNLKYHYLRKLDDSTLIGFTRDTPEHARKITIDGREEDFTTLKKKDYTRMCTPYNCKCLYIPSLHTLLTYDMTNKTLYLHDTDTGTCTCVQFKTYIFAICQGPADSALVVFIREVVQVTMKGVILRKCSDIGCTQNVCVNKDFGTLALAFSCRIKLYASTTTATWRLELRAQLNTAVTGMDFLPDGRLVAVYANKTCVIMNDKLNKIAHKFVFKAIPRDVVCMSDSEIAVALDNMTISILFVRHDHVIQEKLAFSTQVQYYALRKLDLTTMVGFGEECARKITMDGIEQDFKAFVKKGYPSTCHLFNCKYAYIPCIHTLAIFDENTKIVYLQDPDKGPSKCVHFKKEIYALCQGPEGTVFLVCEDKFLHMSCEGRTLNKCKIRGISFRICANRDFSVIALSNLSNVNVYKLSID